MKPFRFLAATVIATATAFGVSSSAVAATVSKEARPHHAVPSAKRHAAQPAKRKVQRRVVHQSSTTPVYSRYFTGPDPSLGPDGRPYPVPAYLRSQCYYDEGYGRFSACPNR